MSKIILLFNIKLLSMMCFPVKFKLRMCMTVKTIVF